MVFSKVEVIDYAAPDRFLDNSASLKTLQVDSDAENESVTNSLQTKKEVNCIKCNFT